MVIKVKMYCPGMAIQMDGFPMSLTDGATVEDAIRECMKFEKVTPAILDGSFLMNQKPVTLDTSLEDGAQLLIMRVLGGG